MNKLNNLLQNFDYILTIISTIKYLKTEKLLEIHVFYFFCRLNRKILKLQIFAQTSFKHSLLFIIRYFKLNNINSFFLENFDILNYQQYFKFSIQIFVCFWLLESNSKRHSTNILTPCIGYLSDYRKRWDFDGNIAFETVNHGRPDWI